MTTLQGQGVSRGGALGPLVFLRRTPVAVEQKPVEDVTAERERYLAARRRAYDQLGVLYQQTMAQLGEENAVLFQIHQMILEDPDFCEAILQGLEEGSCAAYAVDTAAKTFAAAFRAMEDSYMQSRAADVVDVAARLLRILSGVEETSLSGESPFVLAAEDLVPSETARLDKNRVLAIVTAEGSANSHTAIFARTMGIPAVAGLGAALLSLPDGTTVAVDGCQGTVVVEPDEAALKQLEETRRGEEWRQTQAAAFRGKKTRSKDGRELLLCANVGSLADVEAALKGDAEGIGLFRSEFLYLQRDDYPDEESLTEAYSSLVKKMGQRQVVIRTLDIGADKQADYFQLPKEENPALGLRAVRLCLLRPEIFRTQLRALYRASIHGNLAIMIPMITSVEELRRCKALAAEVREELRRQGVGFREDTPIGVMIETPAAALLSRELAEEADFFSVGTNDLTQYTLALDRQNAAVAVFDDPAHRAVLRLIAMAAESAHAAGIWIGICGELGAEESLAKTFLDMGIDELSVAPAAILPLRASIAQMDSRQS